MIRRPSKSLGLLSAGVLSAVLASAGPAAAEAPYLHERFSGSESVDFEDCGLELHSEITFQGVETIRTVRGSDGQAFFGHATGSFEEVLTLDDDDASTNESVHITGRFNFVELRATHVAGTVWQFQAIQAGSFRMQDADGNVLLHERGVFQLTVLFDTLGDGQPGGELLDETVTTRGPRLGDFCAALEAGLLP